jgi:branched-chain amino acid transport system substrate-binding protein
MASTKDNPNTEEIESLRIENIEFDRIPIFAKLGRVDRARLIPYFAPIVFNPGEPLVRQGDPGDCLYLIIDGHARVLIRKEDAPMVELAILERGDCIGEIALLTGAKRSADVEAMTPVKAVRLSRDRFKELIQKHHSIAIYVADLLADRLIEQVTVLGGTSVRPVSVPIGKEQLPRNAMAPSVTVEAGWLRNLSLKNRRVVSVVLAAVLCALGHLLFSGYGLPLRHIILYELLLAATVIWAFDAFSTHAVALALPLLAVLFRCATPEIAFSGFSSSSWFLVLGIFAITAAITKTGLMYRFTLKLIQYFPPSYFWQSFALAAAGMLLTPAVPVAYGRTVLAGPLVADLAEIRRFRRGSAGAAGFSMAALLGFGHMSFMFMNGTATCLLAFGLLPKEVSTKVTWGSWLLAALPLGLIFFVLSFASIMLIFRPRVLRGSNEAVIKAQLAALGPMGSHEKLTLFTVVLSVSAFLTQSLHHVYSAWVALLSFFILFGFGILNEKSVRNDIDWNFLISFGAIVGFGSVITSSVRPSEMAALVQPLLGVIKGNSYLLLISISLAVFVVRFALPDRAALPICMLPLVPLLPDLGIDSFILCLVVLISCNPWFFPYQNHAYENLVEASKGKLFKHRQVLPVAVAHVVIVEIAILASVPYWRYLGLIFG